LSQTFGSLLIKMGNKVLRRREGPGHLHKNKTVQHQTGSRVEVNLHEVKTETKKTEGGGKRGKKTGSTLLGQKPYGKVWARANEQGNTQQSLQYFVGG